MPFDVIHLLIHRNFVPYSLAHQAAAPHTIHAVQKRKDDFSKHDIDAQMRSFMTYQVPAASRKMKSNATKI